MYFDQKLKGLMQLFKISNSKLARGINVDASLISRWKSGDRAMSANSPHVPAIASFFLRLNAYHYQKQYLDFILKNRLPADLLNDEGRRVHALSDWLISDEPADLSATMEKPQSPAFTKSMIADIAGLMSGHALKPVPRTETGSSQITAPSVKTGDLHEYERHEGILGRRQAVLNFLMDIVQSERKLDLLLTSEDDMSWLTGDRQFTMIWASLLKQIIESGHRITIIHVVNRQREEIINALAYWMPLHLAGTMKSYYYPKYTEQPIKQTLFIARGVSAVVAWSADTTVQSQTFIYHDKATVALYESLYEAHLGQCKPLFSVFTKLNIRELLETGLSLRKREGAIFNIRNHLNSLLLEPAIIKSFLDVEPANIRRPDMMDGLMQHRALFFEKLMYEDYFEILPVDLLDQIQASASAQVDSCLLCLDNPWSADTPTAISWLESMVDTMKTYPHYHVYLSSQAPGLEDVSVNILYKEDGSALFSPSCSRRRQPISIMLNEANILRSLSYYFDDYIQQIPTVQRQKEEVIVRIEKVISSLKLKQTSDQADESTSA